jgi:hypothetical protein
LEECQVGKATRRVDVSVDFYEELERQARFGEDFEAVIRRLIGGSAKEVEVGGADGVGYLLDLINAGLLKAGEQVVMHQPRLGRKFTAAVTGGGGLELPDGRVFKSPSGASNACTNTMSNGWANWSTANGKSLDDLRRELRKGK